VFIHPTSVNHNVKNFEAKWLIFHEKVKTSKVFLRDSTMITVYPLILFGGEIEVNHAKQEITVDKWIRFTAPGKIGMVIMARSCHLLTNLCRSFNVEAKERTR